MDSREKSKLKTVIIIILILGYPVMFFIAFSGRQQPQQLESKYNPQALATCEAPYKQMQDSANNALRYSGAYNFDAKATYQALDDAAKGLQSCETQYGN